MVGFLDFIIVLTQHPMGVGKMNVFTDSPTEARPGGAIKRPNPVRKVRLQIKEDLAQKVTRLKLGATKDSSLWNLH